MLWIVVEEGANRGARYALTHGTSTLGRDVACEVALLDEHLSRRHASIDLADDGGATVADLGSRNGTRVNGLPLAANVRTALAPGDRIQVGATRLRVSSQEEDDGLAQRTTLVGSPRAVPSPDLELRTLRREAEEARTAVDLVAESPAFRRLLEQAARVAAGDAPVLVHGESGSGKELVVRAIHAASPRSRRRLVTVNAAALPEATLVESELFGHERGAFTGAVARRKGLFELAHEGTLFLDELGELPLTTQPKLLRVLETGEVRRLGAEDAIRIDVRFLAATNRDLQALAKEGRFREDLYYRLAAIELRVPPLRERPEDLEPLARHLLARITRGRPVALEPAAIAKLREHRFPGNVRELKNALERAYLLGDGKTVRVADLPPAIGALAGNAAAFPTLAELERAHVTEALRRTEGNRSQAARLLGIDRKTLLAKARAFGLADGA